MRGAGAVVTLPRTYRYVVRDVDRYGKVRWYLRAPGQKKVKLPHPNSPEFEEAYKAAILSSLANFEVQPGSVRTFRWLCHEYMKSAEFTRLDPRTQRTRSLIIGHMLDEPSAPGSALLFGDCPVNRMSSKLVRVLRDRKAKLPHAASGRLKVLRRMFRWAVEAEHIQTNPAVGVVYLPVPTGGFHTFTEREIAQFEKRWPVGTKQRLAFAMLRYLGVRRSDVVKLGRQHVKGGWLQFTVTKGARRSPTALELPIPKQLQAILDASPTGDLTFLVTDQGRPFTADGFGIRFRDWCDAAGLPNCSAHSLRKFAATSLAEEGATPHQLMGWFGWKTLAQAERYTRTANQKKLAASVVSLIGRRE